MFLLDTNVISELRKTRPHGGVLAWRNSLGPREIAIPAVVLAELQDGVEITRRQDPIKAIEIERWIDRIMAAYAIIPIDGLVFREWAHMMAGTSDNLSIDAMIAATARIHRLVVATRDVKDFKRLGVQIVNPFTYGVEESK
ncbi:MAG TPA: type II toxin-antitoxin system VapC family toxin [Terracidiphilus sp.]|nr:type II toxin-antitoxin system VapC family toxin [Terracidiphilus sp.]